MDVGLNREQFIKLLMCVHAASHFMDDDETRELEDRLLEIAAEQGLQHVVSEEKGERSLAPLLSKPLHEDIQKAEDEVFWSSLADEMGEKDMRIAYNSTELEAMDDREYDRTLETFSRYYDTEFEAHGSDHLNLDHPLTLDRP